MRVLVLQEAQDLCEIFMVLHKGKIYGLGTLDELRNTVNSASASLAEIYLKLTQNV